MLESYYAKRVDEYAFKLGKMAGTARSAKYQLEVVLDAFKDKLQTGFDESFERLMKETIDYMDYIAEVAEMRGEQPSDSGKPDGLMGG